MQPRNVAQYTDKMNLVADELIDNIQFFSEQNDKGQMPDDFNHELYKWSLESVGVVTMDKHLGNCTYIECVPVLISSFRLSKTR
jgi:hypothetical protein